MKLKLIIATLFALTTFTACGGDSGKATPNAKKSPKAAKAAKKASKKK